MCSVIELDLNWVDLEAGNFCCYFNLFVLHVIYAARFFFGYDINNDSSSTFLHPSKLYIIHRSRTMACISKKGDFGDMIVMSVAKDVSSSWKWIQLGGELCEWQTVAVRVLATVIGAGASEQNWSAYDFVHSKNQNR